jgi:hypothetical protein
MRRGRGMPKNRPTSPLPGFNLREQQHDGRASHCYIFGHASVAGGHWAYALGALADAERVFKLQRELWALLAITSPPVTLVRRCAQ